MKFNDEEKSLTEKVFDVFVRLAAGFSVSTIIATCFMVFGACELNLFLAVFSLLLGMPTTYIGLTALRNRVHTKFVRDMHMFEQLQRGFEDIKEAEMNNQKEVTPTTAMFYSFIERKDPEGKITDENYNPINSFLFMINENYYEKIAVKTYANISRTTLIEMFIQIIKTELQDGEIFDEVVAEDVINRAFFVSDKVKQEMIEEFRKSKTKIFTKEPLYQIISSKVSMKHIKDILDTSSTKTTKSDRNYDSLGFDIYNVKDYEELLIGMSESEDNQYGDLTAPNWDLETFKEVICLIDQLYTEQLSELYDYYDIDKLAASLLYNTAVYAVLNKKENVGIQEILNTMKNWNYLDYDDILIIIKSIFDEFEGMENIIHPFTGKVVVEEKAESKGPCKIIQFPTQNSKK